MAVFTVHVPPGVADPTRRAERTVFVRDGFNLPAFLFGPLFLAYRGLWLAALGWCAVAAFFALLSQALGLSPGAAAALVVLLCLLTGLEAGEFRRNALRRRGFIPAALLAGVTRENAERLFFSALSEPASGPRAAAGSPYDAAPLRGGAAEEDGVIGLFPRPGGGS